MRSPATALAAAALAVAVGGVLLIAEPPGQRGNVAAAATEAVAPTWVTGSIELATWAGCSGPDSEVDGTVTHQWNYVCSPQLWTATDDRLSGEVASVWNDDAYGLDDGVKVVNMSALHVGNDRGGWDCSSPNLLEQGGFTPTALTGATYTCVGQGGYAGLSAILVLDGAAGYSEGFVGLIFPGDFPPQPEPPVAG